MIYMYMKNKQIEGHSRDGHRAVLRFGERDAASFPAPLSSYFVSVAKSRKSLTSSFPQKKSITAHLPIWRSLRVLKFRRCKAYFLCNAFSVRDKKSCSRIKSEKMFSR